MLLDEIKNIKSTRKDIRGFGLIVGGALALLGLLFLWKEKDFYPYFLITGGGLILTGLLVPSVLRPLQKIWMALSIVLGWVMTRVILVVLFFLVITPIGIMGKLFGKRFLAIKRDKTTRSYWNYRKPEERRREDYERQF